MIIEYKMVTKMCTCLNCELPCEQNPYTLQSLQYEHICNNLTPHIDYIKRIFFIIIMLCTSHNKTSPIT